MSGTSLDGADAVLADFSSNAPRVLAFASVPFGPPLRERLLKLCAPGEDSLDLAGEATVALADSYAQAALAVLAAANVSARDVRAIGCHGQTVRHRPEKGFTTQLNDPARLAERTGIDVVADFRRRDVAAGGQGAPLVPAFHEAVFRDAERSRAVVNIGGIANITWLAPGRETAGFDCGPGNVLMDGWCLAHQGRPFDQDGRWAASGRVDTVLLEQLLAEPFLQLAPPKSTGRELFDMGGLRKQLENRQRAPQDVQATLADFTAACIVRALDRFCPGTQEIYVAGGGARNAHLMDRLSAMAGTRRVARTDELGVPTGQVEALAFAWLAAKCVRREPVAMSAITGARGPRILGAIYPG